MPAYGAISWLPFTVGLTGAGLFLSWLAWRRRGLAAGLRGLSLSLLPLVAYLTGLMQLVWRVVGAVLHWTTHLALSPGVWVGVALAGFAFLLYAVSNRLAAGTPRRRTERLPSSSTTTAAPLEPGRRKPAASADDEFDEIEELLRRRGID